MFICWSWPPTDRILATADEVDRPRHDRILGLAGRVTNEAIPPSSTLSGAVRAPHMECLPSPRDSKMISPKVSDQHESPNRFIRHFASRLSQTPPIGGGAVVWAAWYTGNETKLCNTYNTAIKITKYALSRDIPTRGSSNP